MPLRVVLALFNVMLFCTVAYGIENRWYNFAEDSDLRYYLDNKSIVSRPNHTKIVWVKSVPKSKEYFEREYNLNNLAYLLTNYEIDCSNASYRVRQTLMLDKNRKELSKTQAAGSDVLFEPVPPESSIELAQEAVCGEEESAPSQATQKEEPQATPEEKAQPDQGAESGDEPQPATPEEQQGQPESTAPAVVPELAPQ